MALYNIAKEDKITVGENKGCRWMDECVNDQSSQSALWRVNESVSRRNRPQAVAFSARDRWSELTARERMGGVRKDFQLYPSLSAWNICH